MIAVWAVIAVLAALVVLIHLRVIALEKLAAQHAQLTVDHIAVTKDLHKRATTSAPTKEEP